MNTSTIFFWVFMMIFCMLASVLYYLHKKCPYPASTPYNLNDADEHAQCDCVGCGNSCCECVPLPSKAVQDLWESQLKATMPDQTEAAQNVSEIAKGIVLPHNIVFVIIEMLQDTKRSLEDVMNELGYSSVDYLSLAQLLTMDDKLFRCNVCGYWGTHSNPNTSKYTALLKCQHCESEAVRKHDMTSKKPITIDEQTW
jgi:hypothetical protein